MDRRILNRNGISFIVIWIYGQNKVLMFLIIYGIIWYY